MPPARRSTRTTNPAPAATNTSRSSRRAHPYDRDEDTAADSSFSSASIARDDVNGRTNLRLTVKAPPSKLRQATSGPSAVRLPAHSYDSDAEDDEDEEDEAIDIEDDLDDDGPQRSKRGAPTRRMAPSVSDSDATPAPAARTKRSTRNPRTVIEMDSDDDLDEDAPGEEEDEEEDAEGEEDEEMQEDSEQDAEGEEDDEMEDVQLNRHPPPPVIRTEPRSATKGKAAGKGGAKANGKTQVTVKVAEPPTKAPLKSVEKKQMDLDMDGDDDDDELSELESGDEDENELGDDDDEDEDKEDEEEDDDDDTDADGSRAGTPDLSKLTKRQRGAYEEASEFGLLALSNEAQKKKHLTAEEHAVRRAEMARRRKNLSEKRNEEEKMDTIAKLLSKPAPKRRSRAEMLAAAQAAANSGDVSTPGADEEDDGAPRRRPADPVFTRWVQNREGARVAFPKEWLEGPLADRWAVAEVASNGINSDDKVAVVPAAVESTITKRPHVGITLLEEIV